MNNYYPFGMRFNQAPVVNKQDNNYLYNGKELQQFGLDWYDYGARFYDPQLGRFTGIDPIADKFPHVSTFNYAENEPINSIDLWGLQRLSLADKMWSDYEEESKNRWRFMGTESDSTSSVIYPLLNNKKSSRKTDQAVTTEDGEISDNRTEGNNIGGYITLIGLETVGVGYGFKDLAKSKHINKYGKRGPSGKIYSNKIVTRANKIQAYKYARYAKTAGRAVGFIGAGITAWEGAMDGYFSWGDAANVGIAVVTIFTPYGWVYGLVDIGFGIATGESVSNRIGTAIDDN